MNGRLPLGAKAEKIKHPRVERGLAARLLFPYLACCDRQTFRQWLRVAPRDYERPTGLLVTFCGDCTPEYKQEMTSLGSCLLNDSRRLAQYRDSAKDSSLPLPEPEC